MLDEILHRKTSKGLTVCYTDSHSLHDAVYSLEAVQDKRLYIDMAIQKQAVEKKEITAIKWINKTFQLADSLNKRGASSEKLLDVISENRANLPMMSKQ